MKIDFVTLFPGMFPSVMDASMMARAKDKGLLQWACVNPRDLPKISTIRLMTGRSAAGRGC